MSTPTHAMQPEATEPAATVPATTEPAATGPDLSADAFAERLLAASLGWIEAMSVHSGLQTGWYDALAASESGLSAAELARITATDERYAREWLELQSAYGILVVENGAATAVSSLADASPEDASPADASTREEVTAQPRFRLPAGAAETLLDDSSEAYLGPLTQMLAASAARMPDLIDAYRGGGGVSWSEFGRHARESQAALNRPWLARVPDVLGAVPDLHDLLSRPGARVADVGSGAGWSAIALARAYPGLRVLGIDVDAPSVRMARENAAAAGVADRVEFVVDDAARLAEHGRFDAVFAFECLHDMPHPVEVLAAIRAAVSPDGRVIVMDEAVGDELATPTDELERLMYGFSMFVCLPDGLSHERSAGTGTVMRPPILRRYAREAGYAAVDVLIAEFGFWRFYDLTP